MTSEQRALELALNESGLGRGVTLSSVQRFYRINAQGGMRLMALRDACFDMLRPTRDDLVAGVAADLAPPPPVDRSQRTMTDGSPVTPDHREIDPATGQQKGYVVLSAEERAKGFVRPVRRSYVHRTCGGMTTMGLALAETYARDPGFYNATFCATCRTHFPLDQFTWGDDGTPVGQ